MGPKVEVHTEVLVLSVLSSPVHNRNGTRTFGTGGTLNKENMKHHNLALLLLSNGNNNTVTTS